MDLFSWLIFILFLFTLLFPQLKHRALIGSRIAIIRRLEKKRKSRVITLIHRQERIGIFGVPIFRYIDIEDSEDILRAIRMTPKDMPIDIILHTPGGLVLAAVQIAFAIKEHPAETRVIIPHYAMSGGTLIALAADKIIMDPHAVLGPVDPQIAISTDAVVPAVSILNVVKKKGEKKVEDVTLMKADIAQKALKQVEETVYKLLCDKMSAQKAKKIAKELSEGKWTHDFPITVEMIKKMGLPVDTNVPAEIYELMSLYPQTTQHRPGVEYIPIPYQGKEPSKVKK